MALVFRANTATVESKIIIQIDKVEQVTHNHIDQKHPNIKTPRQLGLQ